MLRAIRALLHRRRAERDLEREIAFHIENATASNIAAGMHPEEAARRARVAFGSIENTKEAHRDGRGARWIEDLFTDIRYALRQFRHAPVFAAVAVIVLGFGIGVNAALVSFVDTLMRPRLGSVDRAHELVQIDALNVVRREDPRDALLRNLIEFKDEQTVLSSVAFQTTRSVLAGTGATQDVRSAAFVSGDYFATLRPKLALGRLLPVNDDRELTGDASALISFEHWRVGYGSDSSVLGQSVTINGVPTTIVGVLADGFSPRGAAYKRNPYQFWLPLGARALYFESDSAFWSSQWNLVFTGRLNVGATIEDARAAVGRFAPVCQGTRPSREMCRDDRLARSFVAIPPQEARSIRIVGLVLSILTGLILAIACANLSILLLGRAVSRRREIAVRLSLGAGRKRVIRQLLTESILLASIGGVVGLALLMAFRPISRSLLSEFQMDLTPSWITIAVSMSIAMVTGIAFGMIPALHATRASVATALKESVAGFDRGRAKLQRRFVISEVTVSIALVSIMGLFVQAVRKTVSVDPGYSVTPSVLIASLPMNMTKYPSEAIGPMMDEVQRRTASLPGVDYVSVSNVVPTVSYMAAYAELEHELTTQVALIDDSYFGATGVQLTAGRGIGADDTPSSPPSVVVTEPLARLLWPGQNPIGRTLPFATSPSSRRMWPRADSSFLGLSATVVGVADSVGDSGMGGKQYLVYMSRRQMPQLRSMLYVTVRTSQAPATVAARVIDEIHAVDPALPISGFKSTLKYSEEGAGEAVQLAWGAIIAGILSLGLACVGLFAVVAFAVANRSREIGIRVALGATQQQVVRRFFGEGMRMTVVGFVIGVPIAIAFMRIAQSQVLGVPTVQPLPILLVVLVLLVVTALASWLPARRATRVDPIETLRSE